MGETQRGRAATPFEVKLEAVSHFLAGEGTSTELAAEYGLSSRKLLKRWVQLCRA